MTDTERKPALPRPPATVTVRWAGDHRFDSGRPGKPLARFDGSGETGQSPVDALLSALASCTSIDVIDILGKRRTPPSSLDVEVVGERVAAVPGRFTRITLNFRIVGTGIGREHALRAIELGVTKYCSVRDSLASDIKVDWTLDLKEG